MQDTTGMAHVVRTRGAVAIVAALGLALTACGGDEGSQAGTPGGGKVQVNAPAQIAQVSADNYNDNVNGVITGRTLSRWMSDWENERPTGVTGRLIILQQGAGPAGAEYVDSNPPHVYTYALSSGEISMNRDNGVIVTPTIVADGEMMDALLKKYAIDPRQDMIVCARGSGSILNQARCWYTLRYWGVPKRNLAYLNGSYDWQVNAANPDAMLPTDFAPAASVPPNNGTVSVRDLPEDNFALIATLEDMMAAAKSSPMNDTSDRVLVWDARGMNQYSAGEATEMGQSGCAFGYCGPVPNRMSTFQNNATRQGHPHGALQLQYTNMYVNAEGQRLKSKAELAAYMNGAVDANGLGFADYTYQPVGVGNAYQPGDTVYVYCETTQRAQVTGLVSAAVLGLPTRYYDGAMIEWNSMSNIAWNRSLSAPDASQDAPGNAFPVLPADSPWRTDLASMSFFYPAEPGETVNQRDITDPYAARSNATVVADRTYKYNLGAGGGGGGGGGGGVTPPSNPCGG